MNTGRNASIGPVLSIPSSARQPILEHRRDDAERRRRRQQVHAAAASGIAMLRNTAISSRKLSTTTIARNSGSLRERRGEVVEDRRLPPDEHAQTRSSRGGRYHLVADRVQQRGRRGVLGEPLG